MIGKIQKMIMEATNVLNSEDLSRSEFGKPNFFTMTKICKWS